MASKQPWHYTQCGLDNVWLENGFELRDTPYGRAIAVHDVDGLHRLLAGELARKQGALTGREFRFLRSWLGLTQEGLASLMDVSEGALSLWERKGAVPAVNDKLLRLMVLAQTDGDSSIRQAIERVNTVQKLVHQKFVVREREGAYEVQVRKVRTPVADPVAA
jgi:DNA-binding transcriptional regulator YiaG